MTTYAETMRAVIRGASKSFVVFEHGTVVILADADAATDLAEAAKELLREYGPVHPGSPAGDFGTLELPDDRGFAVTGHHPDILTLVLADEAPEAATASDIALGMMGRSKRGMDASALTVVHVQDARGHR